jgi:hypothetical protein
MKRGFEMFVREIKSKDNTYVAIVENYREKGRIRQRCIASLGNKEKLLTKSGQLKNVVLSLLKYCKERDIFNISKAKEKGRYRWGCVKVYRRLWDRFGLDKILSMISKERKVRFDYFSAIFLMIVDRLTEPKSKLKSYEEQDRYYGIARSDLHHLYRALDILAEGKEKIEEFLFERNKNLFNIKVNALLYDVTTLYFESVKVDSMRDFGFSKVN